MTQEEYRQRLLLFKQLNANGLFYDEDRDRVLAAMQAREDFLFAPGNEWMLEKLGLAPSVLEEMTAMPLLVPEGTDQVQNTFFKPLLLAEITGRITDPGGLVVAVDVDGDQRVNEATVIFRLHEKDPTLLHVTVLYPTGMATYEVPHGMTDPMHFNIVQVEATDGVEIPVRLLSNGPQHITITPNYEISFSLGGQNTLLKATPLDKEPTVRVLTPPEQRGKLWYMELQVGASTDMARVVFEHTGEPFEYTCTISYLVLNPVYSGIIHSKKLTLSLSEPLAPAVLNEAGQQVTLALTATEALNNIVGLGISHQLSTYGLKEKKNLQSKYPTATPEDFGESSLFSRPAVVLYYGEEPHIFDFPKEEGRVDTRAKAPARTEANAGNLTKRLAIRDLPEVDPALTMNAEVVSLQTAEITLLEYAAQMGITDKANFERWKKLNVTLRKSIANNQLLPAEELAALTEIAEAFIDGYFTEFDGPLQPIGGPNDYGESGLGDYYKKYSNEATGEKVERVKTDNPNHLLPDLSGNRMDLTDLPRTYEVVPDYNTPGMYISIENYLPSAIETLVARLQAQRWDQLESLLNDIQNRYAMAVAYKMGATKGASYSAILNAQRDLRTRLLRQQTKKGRKALKKVSVVFYPEEFILDKDKRMGEIGIPMNVYYYADLDQKCWYVINLSNSSGFEDYVYFSEGHDPTVDEAAFPPQKLFEELGDKDNLPAGWLYYQIPGGPGGGFETLGTSWRNWEWEDWIKIFGVAALTVAAIIALPPVGGAIGVSTTTAGFIGTAGAITVGFAGGMAIYKASEEDHLDTMTLVGGLTDIAAAFMGTLGALAKAGKIGKLIAGFRTSQAYLVLKYAEGTADTVAMAVTNVATLEKIAKIYDNEQITPERKTWAIAWEVSYLVLQNALTVVSVKGTSEDIAKFRRNNVGEFEGARAGSDNPSLEAAEKVGDVKDGKKALAPQAEKNDGTAGFKKEREVINREKEVVNREKEVVNREKEVVNREKEVVNREKEVVSKENNPKILDEKVTLSGKVNERIQLNEEQKKTLNLFSKEDLTQGNSIFMVKLPRRGLVKVNRGANGGWYYLSSKGRPIYITKRLNEGKLKLQEAQLNYGNKKVLVGTRGGLYYKSILGNEKRYIPSTRRKHVQLEVKDVNP